MSEMVIRLAKRGMCVALVGMAVAFWYALLELSWLAIASSTWVALLFLWTVGLFFAFCFTWLATEGWREWWQGT